MDNQSAVVIFFFHIMTWSNKYFTHFSLSPPFEITCCSWLSSLAAWEASYNLVICDSLFECAGEQTRLRFHLPAPAIPENNWLFFTGTRTYPRGLGDKVFEEHLPQWLDQKAKEFVLMVSELPTHIIRATCQFSSAIWDCRLLSWCCSVCVIQWLFLAGGLGCDANTSNRKARSRRKSKKLKPCRTYS